MAEKLALVLYALGVVSLAGLYLNYKKHAKANLVSFIAVITAIVSVFFATETGTTGGEIRHTEIRANAAVPATAGETQEEDKD
jgi:hypothetical protein